MDRYKNREATIWHSSARKEIRITLDEALLERLDRLPGVRERGRSAVLREATVEYLNRLERQETARRFRAGYLDTTDLDHELDGWTDEGILPAD